MKRVFSILLILLLLFSLAVPAFAVVPAVSALVAVGAMDEPFVSDVVPDIDEPVISDFDAVAPAMGELAATAETSFSPVYSPESYLVQSLIGYNIDVEELRPIVSQYKYCQILYNQKMKKILVIALYSSLSLNDGSLLPPESDRFPIVASENNPINIIDFRYDGSFTQNILKFGSYPIMEDFAVSSGLDCFPNDSGNAHLYSFNFDYVYNGQKKRISSTSPNSILSFTQTGVVPVEPPFEPENPFPDLGGEVTLKQFSDILDKYIADTCAPNGDVTYDLERLKGTTINFSYRNSYGSGSNVISFKDGYVYVNGAKYDFNKDAVSKKKVFGIGKSGIIDTIFGDYDVVTKHIVKLDTDKDAKVVLVKKEHFGSYNFDDFPVTYSIRPAGSSSPEPDLGDDKTNGFEGDYGVKILMPHNGFKQSKLNAITTKIYYKIPFNGDETKHNIKVSGYVGDSRKTVSHTTNKLENNTIIEGYLDVLGAVNWDKVTPISITITDYTGKTYTCSVNVLCYSDFVDNDGDGLDDRTNQDEWTGSTDLNKPIYPDNSPPEGSNVVEWFKWFFSQIGQFFDTLKSGFDSVISYGADFSKFLGSAFSYLPSEISVIIGLGFTALVFLRIFGR